MRLKKRIIKFKQVPTDDGTLLEESININSNSPGFFEKDLFNHGIIDYYLGNNSGIYLILPKGQLLLNALIGLLRKELGQKLGFLEYSLPKIITPTICHQARIVGKWDDYLLSVRPYRFTKGTKEEHILDPLQCTPFYAYLKNKKLNDKDLPLKVFDVSGPSYRNEDKSELSPLIKQLEFKRMEFIYFGRRQDIINIREKMLSQLENICFDLNLPFRRVIGSGCYEVTSNLVKYPESLETIPVIDLELKLPRPFKKRNKKMYFLEVIGASILRNQQTARFNIKLSGSKDSLWSGCLGVGINRLLYVFLANNGFDYKFWPTKIKAYLKK